MPDIEIRAGDEAFLSGGGEIGALLRNLDWSKSPLGPPSTWSQSLRAVVSLLLHSKFPMFVAWGQDLGFIYNAPYAEILASKHSEALGGRFQDIWAEIWPDISPLVEAALAGEATFIALGWPDESFPANAVVSERKPVAEATVFVGFEE